MRTHHVENLDKIKERNNSSEARQDGESNHREVQRDQRSNEPDLTTGPEKPNSDLDKGERGHDGNENI